MPLQGSENTLAAALNSAAKATQGDSEKAWEKVAEIIVQHISANAVVVGTTPNGGPLLEGRIT